MLADMVLAPALKNQAILALETTYFSDEPKCRLAITKPIYELVYSKTLPGSPLRTWWIETCFFRAINGGIEAISVDMPPEMLRGGVNALTKEAKKLHGQRDMGKFLVEEN